MYKIEKANDHKGADIWLIRHIWRDSKERRHTETMAVCYKEDKADICLEALKEYEKKNELAKTKT